MTQLLFDGRKAVNVDLLVGNEGWTVANDSAPLPEEVRRYYEFVGLLYRCTHIRADSLSKVPWAIVNDADKTLWEKGQPCPPQLIWLKSLPRFLHKSEAALTLASQAYWHKERNRVRVTGLRWFAPIATAPYWDTRLGLTHFERNVGVGLEKYPTDEIVYLRYEHPLHETLRDRSPAEAAMAAAGVLYNVDQFVANFFERGAIKATLLTVKGNPSKEEKERLKAWWNRVFSGIKNAFKTDVISADAVTPVVVGEGIQELSNTDLTGEKRADVAITLGVPLSMVFSDAANYATAEQDEKNFYNSTIVPDCTLMAEQINEELLNEYGLHLVFRPEAMDIYQEDENEKAQSFAVLVNAGIKRSVAAQMLGMELPEGIEYEDLDDVEEEEPALPVNPATNQADGAQPPVTDDEEDDPAKASEVRRFRAWARKRKDPNPEAFHSRLLSAADKTAILSELKGGGADQDFFLISGLRATRARVTLPNGPITPDAYKAMLLQLDPQDDEAEQKIRLELERGLERKLLTAFREQLADLLPGDAGDDAIRAAPGRVEATSQPVREVLRLELERSSSLGVSVALDTFQRIGLGFDWTLANTDAARWASTYSFDLVRRINATTAQRLQVAVDDWFRERTTLRDLVRELEPNFGRERALLIAITETTRAAAEGSVIGFEHSGVVQESEWVSVRDERVCPICGEGPTGLHGKRAPLRGTFPGGRSYPPAHPKCRCFVRPVIDAPSDSRLIAASQPVAGPKPSGPPVSGALKLPSSGKYKPIYEEAVGAIDAVHGDGTLPELPVVTKSNMDAYGQYRAYSSGKALDITINGKGDHHQLTLAHEIGHFLDHQAIGKAGAMASERDPLMDTWRQAVDNSAAVARLQDKKRNPNAYVAEVEISGSRFITKPDRIFTGYLLDRRELWARSYAQYIAQRSGNEAMLAQLAQERVDPIYGDRQWDDEDFRPIAAAIDELFRGLGWRL